MSALTGGSVAGEPAGPGGGAVRAAAETLAFALVFAAAGAWPAPDVNEAHFLAKARHWMDPTWGHGDFFLETSDAHGVFYALAGPLAAALPLEVAAWIGRILGWLAVAAGFRHAIMPLVATSAGRLLAAAGFSLALRTTTVAGEWVIGGCEAKVFAWALVIAGLGEIARGRFGPAWLACGAATAFHPVVGGWSLVALAATWLMESWTSAAAGARTGTVARATAAWLVAGTALAACGVVPALAINAGADAGTRAAGNALYVVERLPHHLLPRSFAAPLVTRHLLAIAVWWLLQRFLPATPARRRVARSCTAALVISLGGWLLSLAEPVAPTAVYAALRCYWFRFADVLVPFALATAAAGVLEDGDACRSIGPVPPALLRCAAVVLLGLDLLAESNHWPLPGRVVHARADSKVDAAAWEEVCAWVRDHAPADACFLTPRGSASFVWRTGRGEVVSWKNSPQDARALVEWRRRIVDCFSRDGGLARLEPSTAALGVERLRAVAVRYGADHAIVPLTVPGLDSLPFPRIHANASYAVIRLVPLTAGGSPADLP